jgi:hypothetical protein
MGAMNLNKRRAVGVVVLGFGALALAARLTHPRKTFAPARAPRPAGDVGYVHPIMPSAPVVNPPPPTCRARDLHDVARATRQTAQKVAQSAAHGQPQGGPASCREAAPERALVGEVDGLARVTSGCVARDATLDSQWNLVQSAAVALDACADCTHPRGARTGSCTRALELVAAAEKATP